MTRKSKPKYYVVWNGYHPGIYDNWQACLEQVKGYPNAKYRSFATRGEAEKAFEAGYPAGARPSKKAGSEKKRRTDAEEGGKVVQWNSISVDAACSGNPGVMEYRGVKTDTGEPLFHKGPFPLGTNNIGEFLALVHALAMLRKNRDESTPVYSDSRIAIGWVKAGKARTKLERNKDTEILFRLIKRAEDWLKENRYKNPILKWDTENWGEIPADFGRKS